MHMAIYSLLLYPLQLFSNSLKTVQQIIRTEKTPRNFAASMKSEWKCGWTMSTDSKDLIDVRVIHSLYFTQVKAHDKQISITLTENKGIWTI